MHVALAADGRCVAELLRDAFDRGDDVALRLGLAIVLLELCRANARGSDGSPSSDETPFRDLEAALPTRRKCNRPRHGLEARSHAGNPRHQASGVELASRGLAVGFLPARLPKRPQQAIQRRARGAAELLKIFLRKCPQFLFAFPG